MASASGLLYNSMKRLSTFLISIFLLSSCLQEDPLKLPNTGFTPLSINDGWNTSTPGQEQVDINLLKEAFELFYSADAYPMAKSLLVIRNGKLIAEAYAKDPEDAKRLNNIQSCTKSVTSILAGIAIKEGIVPGVNTPLYKYMPEHFDSNLAKRKLTLRNCLTMQGGLHFDNSIHTEQLFHTPSNSLNFVLNRPLQADTGSVFLYNDGLPHLAGGLISQASGMPLEAFADKYLFQPLGIKSYHWEKAKDGLNFGAFSLHLQPRDLAKIGQLCLQQGQWNGQTVFESSWIKEATRIHAGTTRPYGYYFWITPSLDGFYMWGHGGQFVYVCPSKSLVVVYTAFPYTSPMLWGDEGRLMELIYRASN
jgi:CubicO group peptidase (beta-lactamase class C family)